MSLAWEGDDLVDVVGGWRRWDADGAETPGRVSWAYPFDQAVVSPSGRFHVIYAERGTKALLLDNGRVVMPGSPVQVRPRSRCTWARLSSVVRRMWRTSRSSSASV